MWKSLAFLGILGSLIPSSLSTPQGSLPFPNPIESMPCSRNEQCTDKFPDTDCRNGRFCQCQKGFIREFDKCLPVILDLVSECRINAQCAQGLGNLSRCNEDTHRCECYDSPGNGKNSTAYAPHQCYYRKELGDGCDISEECRASIGPPEFVRCDVKQRACVCEEGKTCENLPGSGSSVGNSVTLFLVGLVAVKVIM